MLSTTSVSFARSILQPCKVLPWYVDKQTSADSISDYIMSHTSSLVTQCNCGCVIGFHCVDPSAINSTYMNLQSHRSPTYRMSFCLVVVVVVVVVEVLYTRCITKVTQVWRSWQTNASSPFCNCFMNRRPSEGGRLFRNRGPAVLRAPLVSHVVIDFLTQSVGRFRHRRLRVAGEELVADLDLVSSQSATPFQLQSSTHSCQGWS